MMGDFLREAFPKKEKVPAGVSAKKDEKPQAQEQPKVYDSIKVRKKAERLMRRHEREQQKSSAKSSRNSIRENAGCGQRSESKQRNAAGLNMMFSGMETFNGTETFSGTGPGACPGKGRGIPLEWV